MQINLRNNVSFQIDSGITSGSSILKVRGGKEGILPPVPFLLTLLKFDSAGSIIQREIVRVTNTSGNILTILRAYESCPKDYSSIIHVQVPYDFDAGDYAFHNITSGNINEIILELNDIRNDSESSDLTLQKNTIVSSHTANYTLLANETRNETFSMSASGGNRTFTLNPALFPTTNGCFEFTFVKSDSSANTVTIDVGSGNTIDGSQTYVLTAQNESVTLQLQSSTFAKVIATSNRPISVSVQNHTQSIVAGENIIAGRMVRMGKTTNGDASNPNTILQNTGGGTSNMQYHSYTTGAYETGQGITPGQTGLIKEVSVWIQRVGALNDLPFNLEVFSDAAFTTLIGTSLNSSNQNLIGTSFEKITFNFLGVGVTNGTPVYIKINKLNTTVSTSNYIRPDHSASSVYGGGIGYSISNANVVTTYAGGDLRFEFITETVEDATKVYHTDSSLAGKIDYIGEAVSTTTKNNSAAIATGTGAIVSQTGLTAGSEYFLNGTAGEIGTTAGTFSKKVGLALSTTSLFLYENVSEKFSTSFIASRDLSLATSTVSYSHNLGRIPKQVTASSIRGSSPASDGVIVEGLQSCIYSDTTGGLSDSVNAIRIHTGTGAFVTGFIQNITATSFDVVYTRTSTPTGTAQILFILQ